MRRLAITAALAAVLLTSCFSPGASGPGFRWAPPEIRSVDWSDRVAKLHGTLTVADQFHGNRVYIVHLPEDRIVEHYLPFVDVLDACAIPGTDEAYALLTDGRIVRTGEDLDGPPLYRRKYGFVQGSTISLSPDGRTIVLAAQTEFSESNHHVPLDFTLIDVSSGRASALRCSSDYGRPCWAPDGKSIFVVEPEGDILQCPLAPGEPAHTVARGSDPVVSEDQNWLIFSSREMPALMRWKIGTSEEPELLLRLAGRYLEALAVDTQSWVIHLSDAEDLLPCERSGLLMQGPYCRQAISITVPQPGASVPLFVGMIPTSAQWRWD